MRKYCLQLYRQDTESCEEEYRIFIDDLPFQPSLLERLADIGIIDFKERTITQKEAEKVNKIIRLRNSLGVNLSGAAIIIELLDRIEEMEDEIKRRNKT